MSRLRIALSLLAAIVCFGTAHAQAEDPANPPPDVDAARQSERHAIAPGTEAVIGDLLGKGESLAGCTLSDGKIERTSVLATYTCGAEQVVLQLLHPDNAPSGATRTERFAVSVQSGTPPAGLVEAVTTRIRAREAAFDWTDVGDDGIPPAGGGTLLPWVLAALIVIVTLALRARRRRATSA